MAYISEANLRYYADLTALKQMANIWIVDSPPKSTKSIFLSHSHKDRALVIGLINYLASLQIKLYVDWQDSSMPRITGRTTAENIKKRIAELDFFLILATSNAMNSHWVPWEIGVADQVKTLANIGIIPVTDKYGNFEGNEYLQLYRRIELDNIQKKFFIYEQNSYTGRELATWLR